MSPLACHASLCGVAYRVPWRYCSRLIVGSDASASTALVEANPRSVVSARVPSTSQTMARADAKSGTREGEDVWAPSWEDARGLLVVNVVIFAFPPRAGRREDRTTGSTRSAGDARAAATSGADAANDMHTAGARRGIRPVRPGVSSRVEAREI